MSARWEKIVSRGGDDADDKGPKDDLWYKKKDMVIFVTADMSHIGPTTLAWAADCNFDPISFRTNMG